MKKKSQRIQLVIDLAQRAETQAAKNLGLAQDAAASEKQRLKDIKQYYAAYEQHFLVKTNSLRASDIANSREFLSNLDNACHAQELQWVNADKQVEVARELWRKTHLKTQSVESYQERCQFQEQQEDDKREQGVVDEISLRNYRLMR